MNSKRSTDHLRTVGHRSRASARVFASSRRNSRSPRPRWPSYTSRISRFRGEDPTRNVTPMKRSPHPRLAAADRFTRRTSLQVEIAIPIRPTREGLIGSLGACPPTRLHRLPGNDTPASLVRIFSASVHVGYSQDRVAYEANLSRYTYQKLEGRVSARHSREPVGQDTVGRSAGARRGDWRPPAGRHS